MGETQWTKAQTEAIDAVGQNILVSAAAGSGKTAVLVERVIRMITRQEDPLDIDRLVIVTFTRAAAAQMKNKIYKAIRDRIHAGPDNAENRRLREQLMKVQSARICTIDSLCTEIVREHIQDVDLDPDFRIADEASLNIMKRDVLKVMLEDCYNEAQQDFMDFVQYYTDKNDNKLEDIILTLYSFSQSHPEPYAWLRSCTYPYLEANSLFAGEPFSYPDGRMNWMEAFAKGINERTAEISSMAVCGLRISKMSGGPWQYEDIFNSILGLISSFEGQSFDFRVYELRSFLDNWKQAPRISSKNADVDENLKNAAMEIRKEIKKRLEDLRDDLLYDDLETIYKDMAACAGVVQTISELVIRFSEEYGKAKKRRLMADFSDIAHNALKILIRYNEQGEIERDENGRPLYTEAADIMAGSVDQVIVDEYQDTNLLQEYLVKALSGERFGKPNVFMVGDVKQSIYGFRMACPELFNEKLDTYCLREDADLPPSDNGRKIILDSNFRSRKEILDFTNLVFSQSMIREVGGIEYTDGHALTYGGLYGPYEEETHDDEIFTPEVLMLEGSGEQAKNLEAYMIASRIEKLISDEHYQYSDIVILTRTSDNPQLERILYERGIPVIRNSNSGFFASFEIRLLLDLLKIVDNPYQDIPFAAVLYSPLCSLNADGLAKIKLAGSPGDALYECLVNYCISDFSYSSGEILTETGDQTLWKGFPDSLARFLEQLEVWRNKAFRMSIYDLTDDILENSGLCNIIAAMPQGKDRLANIDMFKALAGDFAKGGYAGIFEFLCYIDNLQETGTDFGNRITSGPSGEAVRLMTIHKSKGLEFPVVILAGCGKKYNEADLNASIIPDRTLGLGLEKRDPQTRMIRKTAFMQTVRQKKRRDLYAEEMRLLYVAMTRAQEKLIITGTVRQLDPKIRSWERMAAVFTDKLETFDILHSGSFLGLLGASLHRYRNEKAGFVLQYLEDTDMEGERAQQVLISAEAEDTLMRMENDHLDISLFSSILDYEYPYQKAAHMLGKVTASQLENHDIRGVDYNLSSASQTDDETRDYMDSDRLTGARRGNAYHKFFELMDYSCDITGQLERFVQKGYLDPAEADAIEKDRILAFLDSGIGRRMGTAFRAGTLRREKQFVMGTRVDVNSEKTISGEKYHSDAVDMELLLVQGIIDAYFTELDPDGSEYIVLVDYKTDRITDGQYYIDKYAPQLQEYASALHRGTGLIVKERIIYSLESGREIPIPEKTQDSCTSYQENDL